MFIVGWLGLWSECELSPQQAPVSPGQSPVTSAFLVGCKIVRQWRFSGGSVSLREGLQVYIPDPLCSMVIRHVNKQPHTCSPTVTSNCRTHRTHVDFTVKSVSLNNLSGHSCVTPCQIFDDNNKKASARHFVT